MSTTNTATFDRVDAAYIFAGLLDSYREHVKAVNAQLEEVIEHHSGECHLMAHMFNTAIDTAQALSMSIDFESADLGMFAYEHLDSNKPGSLIYAVWINSILEHGCAFDVVAAYVNAMGWPRKDSPAPTK